MNLYDESEHVISSDEYSDEDDNEALMNDAVRVQDNLYLRSKSFNHPNKQSKFAINQKQKELSSLIRKNKISIIYKNKSIRWLNNKKQRERYKELIYQNESKKMAMEDLKEVAKETKTVENDSILVQSAGNVADSYQEVFKNNPERLIDISTKIRNNLEEKKTGDENCEEMVVAKEITEGLEEDSGGFKKEKSTSESRDISSTPNILYEDVELKLKHKEKSPNQSHQFYKSLNDIYPKFDNIVTDHINTITKNTLTSVEEKMKSLINEINTLSEILNAKEIELNRLLHLKTVKEEIYSRLRQKRQNLLIENYSKMGSHRNLEDLRELEFYLSENKSVSSNVSLSNITTQKLIEKRANMNTEDLEREKKSTSRLHSLLVSTNMLHGKESSESVSFLSNGKRTNLVTTSKNSESLKQFDAEAFVSKRTKQGELKEVKSIITDFRKKYADILPIPGKQINLSNSELDRNNSSIPVQDKKFSSTYFHSHRQSNEFSHENSVEEILISPIRGFKKLPTRHDAYFVNMNSHFNIGSEDNYLKNCGKADFDRKSTKNIHYPLCQECKTNESRFVCAGCGNQWYCSKKCQVSAWDKHSDLCKD